MNDNNVIIIVPSIGKKKNEVGICLFIEQKKNRLILKREGLVSILIERDGIRINTAIKKQISYHGVKRFLIHYNIVFKNISASKFCSLFHKLYLIFFCYDFLKLYPNKKFSRFNRYEK